MMARCHCALVCGVFHFGRIGLTCLREFTGKSPSGIVMETNVLACPSDCSNRVIGASGPALHIVNRVATNGEPAIQSILLRQVAPITTIYLEDFMADGAIIGCCTVSVLLALPVPTTAKSIVFTLKNTSLWIDITNIRFRCKNCCTLSPIIQDILLADWMLQILLRCHLAHENWLVLRDRGYLARHEKHEHDHSSNHKWTQAS